MEEKKEEQTKLTYEQLENVAVQLQQKCAILENKLRSIDGTTIRLNYLLKVLETKDVFPAEFITKCASEVEDILTIEDEKPKVEEIKE